MPSCLHAFILVFALRYYAKRCFLALMETLAKHMMVFKDEFYHEIMVIHLPFVCCLSAVYISACSLYNFSCCLSAVSVLSRAAGDTTRKYDGVQAYILPRRTPLFKHGF
jgi:hypothetical protein